MPAMGMRRVIRAGDYSAVIALPIDWRRYFQVDPGTEVKILYDSLLIIIPPACEQRLQERWELVKKLLE